MVDSKSQVTTSEQPGSIEKQESNLELINKLIEATGMLGLSEYCYDVYKCHEGFEDVREPVSPLPAEYGLLIEEVDKSLLEKRNPLKIVYALQGWEKGVARRVVGISNVSKVLETDDLVVCLAFEKLTKHNEVPSYSLSFQQTVNYASFTSSEGRDRDPGVFKPWGQSIVEYDISERSMNPTSMYIIRMDETMFPDPSRGTPARWSRILNLGLTKGYYEETYIFDRPNRGVDTQATIRYGFNGSLENPENLVIEIGFGGMPESGEVLHEKDGVRIILHDKTMYGGMIDMLKQDPRYSFLETGDFTKKSILALLYQKARDINDQWYKRDSVFTGDSITGGVTKLASGAAT